MKTNENTKKIRSMNQKEAKAELSKTKKELALLSLRIKAGKADNMSEIKKKRKDVARILTIINENANS